MPDFFNASLLGFVGREKGEFAYPLRWYAFGLVYLMVLQLWTFHQFRVALLVEETPMVVESRRVRTENQFSRDAFEHCGVSRVGYRSSSHIKFVSRRAPPNGRGADPTGVMT